MGRKESLLKWTVNLSPEKYSQYLRLKKSYTLPQYEPAINVVNTIQEPVSIRAGTGRGRNTKANAKILATNPGNPGDNINTETQKLPRRTPKPKK